MLVDFLNVENKQEFIATNNRCEIVQQNMTKMFLVDFPFSKIDAKQSFINKIVPFFSKTSLKLAVGLYNEFSD